MSDEKDRTRDEASPPRRVHAGIAVAALLIYLASPGPVVGLLIRLKLQSGSVEWIFVVVYYPLILLCEQVKFIDDFYTWYVALCGG